MRRGDHTAWPRGARQKTASSNVLCALEAASHQPHVASERTGTGARSGRYLGIEAPAGRHEYLANSTRADFVCYRALTNCADEESEHRATRGPWDRGCRRHPTDVWDARDVTSRLKWWNRSLLLAVRRRQEHAARDGSIQVGRVADRDRMFT